MSDPLVRPDERRLARAWAIITLIIGIPLLSLFAVTRNAGDGQTRTSANTQTAFSACMGQLRLVDKRASDFTGSPSMAERGCHQSADLWFNADGTMKVSMGAFCRQNVNESECRAEGF